MPIPKEIQGQKYICLKTFRKSGVAVNTPVWFAEHDSKLYAKTRIGSGKSKRIRNNPNVLVAPLYDSRQNYRTGVPQQGANSPTRTMEAGPGRCESQILVSTLVVEQEK